MKLRSLVTSFGFHAAVVVMVIVGLPFAKRDFDAPVPILVDFVDIADITQTTNPNPSAPPKPPAKKEEPKKEDAKPPPAAKNTAQEAVVPVKKEEPPKKAKKPPQKPKKDKVLVDENALPDKKDDKKDKKKNDKKKETTKKADPKPQKSFASVLKNLELQDDKPNPAPSNSSSDDLDLNLEELFHEHQGQNAQLGTRMTVSQTDALIRQLEKCWNVPFGAKDAENLQVEIFMVINQDRTLRAARIVDQKRYNKDTFFRAAADSAMRAVRAPLCSPFELPPDKYDVWKTTIVVFDPSSMF